MALYLGNRDGGKTDQQGHTRPFIPLTGEVIEGLAVTQNSPAGLSVLIGVGRAIIPYSGYWFGVWNDAALAATVSTPNASNPRRDFVVLYIDLSVTPQTVTANNPGIPKAAVVAGTPGAVPADPTVPQIQAAIGASNPYIILRRIDVPAAASTITNGMLTVDKRTFATSVVPRALTPTTITTSQTLGLNSYNNLIDATAGTVTITLPDATLLTGQIFDIEKIDSSFNAVTIATTSSQTINGVTTRTLSTQYETLRVFSDGTNWLLYGTSPGLRRLGSARLSVAGDTLTVNLQEVCRYLEIRIKGQAVGAITPTLRFNNDSGANYSVRIATNSVQTDTATGQAQMVFEAVGAAFDFHSRLWVDNLPSQERLVFGTSVNTAASGSVLANRREIGGKWAGTAQITRVDLVNVSTGDFAIGTEIVVLGHN